MDVINRHHIKGPWPCECVYIGRGTPLGNPFRVTEDLSREEAIEAYDGWLREKVAQGDPVILTALRGLKKESRLVCSCAPLPCHGSVVQRIWSQWRATERSPVRSMAYAGIGSRKTPPEILRKMQLVAKRLEDRGYTLRSGGADGADSAFESGCARQEIFLPWPGFRGRKSVFQEVCEDAIAIARHLHPALDRLSAAGQKLMARNGYQILGRDLKTPADFVLCWTEGGEEHERQRTRETGGTGQAIALASRWDIPVFNMANRGALERVAAFLNL